MSKPRGPIPATGPARFDTAAFFATVSKRAGPVAYPKDTAIFAQGDLAEAMFVITKGRTSSRANGARSASRRAWRTLQPSPTAC